jgi:hypothetical protein
VGAAWRYQMGKAVRAVSMDASARKCESVGDAPFRQCWRGVHYNAAGMLGLFALTYRAHHMRVQAKLHISRSANNLRI